MSKSMSMVIYGLTKEEYEKARKEFEESNSTLGEYFKYVPFNTYLLKNMQCSDCAYIGKNSFKLAEHESKEHGRRTLFYSS